MKCVESQWTTRIGSALVAVGRAVAFLLICSMEVAASSDAVLADRGYPAACDSGTRRDTQPIHENTRVQILRALASPKRDLLLAKLVPERMGNERVGDETATAPITPPWFDLSGIAVRPGELNGKANLSRICWNDATFSGPLNLRGADFSSSVLNGSSFRDQVDLSDAVFDHSSLEQATFSNVTLKGATFRGTNLTPGVSFLRADLSGASFEYCTRCEAVLIVGSRAISGRFQGAEFAGGRFLDVDLTQADLRQADFQGASFAGSTLDFVLFTDTNLSGASLAGAKVSQRLRLVRTIVRDTFFGDLDFSSVDVVYVNWASDYRIGEEREARAAARLEDRQRLLAQAEVIYRRLAQVYKNLGYGAEFRAFWRRSMEARRSIVCAQPSDFIQCALLTMSAAVDAHGTSWSRFLTCVAAVIVFFMVVYLTAWGWFGKHWIEWVEVADGSSGFTTVSPRRFTLISLRDQFRKERRNWRAWLVVESFVLSTQTTFKFLERVVDIPGIVQMFLKRPTCADPVGTGRAVVGIQAVLGLLLGLCALRIFASTFFS